MEIEPYDPIDSENCRVESEYWLMNWIRGPVVVDPMQADIFYNGLDPDRLCQYREARYYNPADEILEIISTLAKIQYGDCASVMRFVGRYGLLGQSAVRNNRVRIVPQPKDCAQLNECEKFRWAVCGRLEQQCSISNSGDPLWWIYAHAKTVRWCLTVTNILHTQLTDDEFFEKKIEIPLQTYSERFPHPGIAIRGDIKNIGVFVGLDDDPYRMWTAVQRLCDKIISENITGIRRISEMGEDGKVRSRYRFGSLIERVYWRLADDREGGGHVHQCGYDRCRALFIQTDTRQRFCPKGADEKESRCSMRHRIQMLRRDPEKRAKEKENQRKRYHEQKHRQT